MNIITIPLRCLRQKWGRSAALLSVFLLGVAAITALNNVSSSVAEGFEKKLSAFGANIAITPKRESLQISYGGIPLGNALVDSGHIPLAETLRAIAAIPLKDRISVVAPKLAGLASFASQAQDPAALVPLVGVDFTSELDLKQFWRVQGAIPGVEGMHAQDSLMMRMEQEHARHAATTKATATTNSATTPTTPTTSTTPTTPTTTNTTATTPTTTAATTATAATTGTATPPPPATGAQPAHAMQAMQTMSATAPLEGNQAMHVAQGQDPATEAAQARRDGAGAQTVPPGISPAGQAMPTHDEHAASSPLTASWAPAETNKKISNEHRLLAGASLAQRLNLAPGQAVLLNGEAFLVEGVLQPTGSDDDSVLFAPIGMAQQLFHAPDAASFIEVAALCSGCPIEDIVSELETALPGQDIRALRQVVAQRMYSISFAQNMALVVTVVILFSACVMVVMSMLVSVNERRKEIGLLRAVGFSRQAVFFIFAAEALVIGFLAGTLGYAAGYLAGGKVLAAMQIEAAAYPAFSPTAMLGYGLLAGALAVLAAAFPAYKAARANPAAALTSL